MLSLKQERGFSLIEMMVVLSILALLLLAGSGSFLEWIANGKVRSVAEDIANGLRSAQSEAMRRNRVVMFAMATNSSVSLSGTPTSTALTLSTAGVNWYSLVLQRTGSGSEDSPAYLQSGNYGTQSGVSVASTSSLVCFGPLGNQIDFSASASNNVLGQACTAGAYNYTVSQSNANKTLKVLLTAGGQVRVCDTSKTLSSTNPDGC